MWRVHTERADFQSTRTELCVESKATFVDSRITDIRNGRVSNGRPFRSPFERFNEINSFGQAGKIIATPACHDQATDQAPGLFLIFS